MRAKRAIAGHILILAIALSGCGGGGTLRAVNAAGDGPDEFSVLPGKPLQSPNSYSDLPVPTPGGVNATDPTPRADAAAALGGRRSAAAQSGIPAADGGLLVYTGRYGVASDIRAQLVPRQSRGGEQRGGFLGRLFPGVLGQTLDKYKELERLRASGIRTPSAPPKP